MQRALDRHRKETEDLRPLLPVFQTAPDQQKRYFRKVKNLISAFEKPDQGIAIPLLYPVSAPSCCPTQEQPPMLAAQNYNQNHSLAPGHKSTPRVKPKKRPSVWEVFFFFNDLCEISELKAGQTPFSWALKELSGLVISSSLCFSTSSPLIISFHTTLSFSLHFYLSLPLLLPISLSLSTSLSLSLLIFFSTLWCIILWIHFC